MSERDFERLDRIFQQVVDLPQAEREAALDELCRDAAERRAIERLLLADRVEGVLPRSSEGVPQAVARALARAGAIPPSADGLPTRLATYEVLRELGEGAMGRVLLARQDGTNQLVALKLIRPGLTLTTPKAVARFEQEARVLGRLGHPGIARVLDAGHATVDGREQPYLAVEYVAGRSLADLGQGAGTGLADRVDLVIQICEAVAHAHEHGVVHRDLKPDNVIVTEDGRAKVLDFGVARVTDAEAPLTTLGSSSARLIGTLAYMSPEQASGSGEVDERSDVYALGVILYELIAGRRPHQLEGLDLVAAARAICERDPIPLVAVAPEAPQDLSIILTKALENRSDRRYPKASALAADLRRFLRDEPISARPPSGVYVLTKLARRHRGLTVGLTLTFVALVVGTIISWIMAVRAMRASDAERLQSYLATLTAASFELQVGAHESAHARLETAPPEHRGLEWRLLSNLAEQSVRTLAGHGYNVWNVAVSPDGARVYSCAGDATVKVWDRESGELLATLEDHGGRVFSVAVSPDGTRFASGSSDRTVRVRDARTHETWSTLSGHEDGAFALAFSPDGESLAVGANNGDLRVWDLSDGSFALLPNQGAHVWQVAFTADGTRLVAANDAGAVTVLDVVSGELLQRLDTEGERAVDVSLHPDGLRLATATTSGEVQIWDLETGELLARTQAHEGELGCVEFAPDGTWLVAGARDGGLSSWATEGLALLSRPIGHGDWVQSLAFTPDGGWLVSGSWDDTVRIWDAQRVALSLAPTPRPEVEAFRVDPEEPESYFVEQSGGRAALLDVWTGRPCEPGLGADTRWWRRRVDAGVSWIERWGGGGPSIEAANGRWTSVRNAVAVKGVEEGWIRVYSIAGGVAQEELRIEEPKLDPLAFDPPGRMFLTTGHTDCGVRVWDVASATMRGVLTGHFDRVNHAAFDTDGLTLLTGGVEQEARLWSMATLEPIGVLSGHGTPISSSAFSPDGTRIVTATTGGQLRIWDRHTLNEQVMLPLSERPITQMAFAAGGELLMVLTEDRELLVLDCR